MEGQVTTTPVVLTPAEINAIPVSPLGTIEGVGHRILWRTPLSMAGVLTVEAGHRLGEHRHQANHHHMWVLDGHAAVLGRTIGPGSYVHIPSGVDHDIDARETEGCTVYYLYLRPGE